MKQKTLSAVKKHPDALSILVIFLSTALVFSRQLFFHRIILPVDILLALSPWNAFYQVAPYNHIVSDIVRQGYPWLVFIVNSVKSGNLPLWNPYLLCGMPSPTAFFPILYPFWPILLLGSLKHSFGYYIMLHVFLAGLFTYLFLRDIKVGPIGALAGGLTFMFSQVFIHWSESIINPASMIWLPVELLLANRLVRARRASYAVLLAGVVAINFFTGMLQFFYYSSLVVLAYALFLLYVDWRKNHDLKNLLKTALFFGLSFVVLLGLSAVQLVPTLELGGLILRTGESSSSIARSVQHLRQVVTFLVPNFYGSPVKGNIEWNLNLEWFMNSGYVGILPLFLALIAVLFSRREQRIFFCGLALVTLVLAFDPLANKILYYLLPFYNKFRSVSRWLPVYSFSISVLAGFGLEFLKTLKREKKKEPTKLKKSIVIFGILMVLSVVFVFIKMASSYDPPLAYQLKQVLIFLGLVVASIVLIVLLLKTRKSPVLYCWCLALLIIADGFIFNFSFYPALDPALAYPRTPSLDYLTRDKSLYRIARYQKQPKPTPLTPTLTPSSSMVYGIQDVQGSSVFVLRRYAQFLNLIEDHGKLATLDEVPSVTKVNSLNSKLLDVLNVKYVLSAVPIKNQKLSLVYDKEIKIYQNKDVLPRTYVVHDWIATQNAREARAILKSSKFNPKTTVVVEGLAEDKGFGDNTIVEGSSAKVEKYAPTEVAVSAVVKEKGLLFLSDTFYPGWKVYVDGKPSKIYRANYNFRGVFLNRGSHKVRFSYCPRSLRTGGVITLVTLIACVGMLVLDFRLKSKDKVL